VLASPQQVDTTWRDLMEAAHASPSVLVLARDPEHLARLEEANKLLEDIQKVRPTSTGSSHQQCVAGLCSHCVNA